MIAEKFQALIAAGAVARALERGNMRERAVEQRGVAETIADPLFERTVAAPAAAARVFWLFLPVLWPSFAHQPAPAPDGVASAWRTALARGDCGRIWLCVGGSSHQREQPVPAHRPRPAPDLPGVGAVPDREEDDLRPADDVLERHVADLR